MIIGARKCGTTSLFKYITEHPNVLHQGKKEKHFYDYHYKKGLEWYYKQFPPKKSGELVGDATPVYLFYPQIPQKIFNDLAQTKFIVILRNPVDCVYSSYNAHIRRKRIPNTTTFEEYLSYQVTNYKDYKFNIGSQQGLDVTGGLIFAMYVFPIQQWFRYFPRNQVLFLTLDELQQSYVATLNKVFSFLNLPPYRVSKERFYNKGKYKPMMPETRKKLECFFAPYNKMLEDLLGMKLGW